MITAIYIHPDKFFEHRRTLPFNPQRTMSGVDLTTSYYYYYVPEFNCPSGICSNHFSSLGDLFDYIDTQIKDCYGQRNDFEACHTGVNGEILELVNMDFEDIGDDGLCIKIYDMNMSQAEVMLDARENLEEFTALFEHPQ